MTTRRTLACVLALSLLSAEAGENLSGLKGQDWWAFRPPSAERVRSVPSLDGAVEAVRKEQGLAGSPEADPRTLIRRVTFDLTGLPPTPEQVSSYLSDTHPEAYSRLVDRLLASPQFGEHWARHWLDVARYSDTKGYVYAREEREFVQASPYRDWVVRSFNENLPYDRFLLLQLAADQLVPAESPDLAAMGFLTLGRRFLGVTHDIIDDRIDVTMRGLQGVTVACARCHDHKFDPISTQDYYSLYGVFGSCAEELVPCGVGERKADEAFTKELEVRREKLRLGLSKRREEQSARVRGTVREHLLAQLELDKYPEEIFGQLLDATDINPVFVRQWQAYLNAAEKKGDPVFSVWLACSRLPAVAFPGQAAEEIKRQRGVHPAVRAAFGTPPNSLEDVAARYGEIFQQIEATWQSWQKEHPGATALPDPEAETLRLVLHGPESPCEIPDESIVNTEMYFNAGVVVELWKLQGEVERWLLKQAGAPPHAGILVDRPVPRKARVFVRGNPLTKGEEVPRRFPLHLARPGAASFQKGSGRLELARHIADRRNPLTARVFVNRVWMHLFGQGLVTTPSDFGTRSALPSHPALLDWLALRFMDDGWNVKNLIRLLVVSDTYRQGSAGPSDPASLARAETTDPGNRFLWRMAPHRLSFEEMRDAWLAVNGDLDLRMGGRPEPLFGVSTRRRTLYSFVDREKLPEVLRTFDFANPDLSIACRSETTVPQQALFGLNHPYVAARATALVDRLTGTESDRLNALYAHVFQRTPTVPEAAAAAAFLRDSEPTPVTPATPSPWSYGYGSWDESIGRVASFTPLPFFNGSAWQGGETWPDATLGWAQLTGHGGHPGNDRAHAVIRRFTAPRKGNYRIFSKLTHEPKVGDGIRAFISHSRLGMVRSTSVHGAVEALDLPSLSFEVGDTLDFIVDIRDNLNSDQFLWSPRITLVNEEGRTGATFWEAGTDFTRSDVSRLSPWAQLAQVLLLSNEFLFLD